MNILKDIADIVLNARMSAYLFLAMVKDKVLGTTPKRAQVEQNSHLVVTLPGSHNKEVGWEFIPVNLDEANHIASYTTKDDILHTIEVRKNVFGVIRYRDYDANGNLIRGIIMDHPFQVGTKVLGPSVVFLDKPMAMEKPANFMSRVLRGSSLVAVSREFGNLMKDIDWANKVMGVDLFTQADKIINESGISLVGNRYMDAFAYNKDVNVSMYSAEGKMMTLIYSAGGIEDFISRFGMEVFGLTGLKLMDNNWIKMANYVWAGCQVSFGRINAPMKFIANHGGGTDGKGCVSIVALRKFWPKLADEMEAAKADTFKWQAFATFDGYLMPVKGCMRVIYSAEELAIKWPELKWEDMANHFFVTANEVKLPPASLKLGNELVGRAGLINHSGEETLRKGRISHSPQLFARTDWDLSTLPSAIGKMYDYAKTKLLGIKTKNGFVESVLGSGTDSIDTVSMAGQIAAGLPLTVFDCKDGSNLAINTFAKALPKMGKKLVTMSVRGSYFYPNVDDRIVGDWEVAISPMLASMLSIRWGFEVVNGMTLMISRSPHIGTGYLPVTVKIIAALGIDDNFTCSRKVAAFLGMDCDGDRVALSKSKFGKVNRPVDFGNDTFANSIKVEHAVPDFGNDVLTRLAAADEGKKIGLVDSLMTLIHEQTGRANMLSMAGIVQKVISSGKHIKGTLVDVMATWQKFVDKSGMKSGWNYKFITCKLPIETYVNGWNDMKKNEYYVEALNAYKDTPLAGTFKALDAVDFRPFWSFDNVAEEKAFWDSEAAAWDLLVSNSQAIVDNTTVEECRSFGMAAPLYGKTYRFYARNLAKATPGMKEFLKKTDAHKHGQVETDLDEARAELRLFLDSKSKELQTKYVDYLVQLVARFWSTGAAQRVMLSALTGRELMLVCEAIRTAVNGKIDWVSVNTFVHAKEDKLAELFNLSASVEIQDEEAIEE